MTSGSEPGPGGGSSARRADRGDAGGSGPAGGGAAPETSARAPGSGWLVAGPPPIEGYDTVLLDLDGVVYVGAAAVPGVAGVLAAAHSRGARLGYVTNNALRTPEEVADHLRRLDVPATPEQVITSSQAAAALIRERLGPGATVLVCGGRGLAAALVAEGLVPVTRADERPAAVANGYTPELTYPMLAEAALAIRAGAWWVSTNTDRTIPTPRGLLPGNGAITAALRTATDREPEVAGKPAGQLFRVALERTGGNRALFVGDRLDTDVAGARAAGLDAMLVLSGVTTWAMVCDAGPDQRPTYVDADLTGLLAPQPAAEVDGDRARCGDGAAQVGAAGVHAGGRSVDDLRAAVALCWSLADAGRPVALAAGAPA